MVLIPISILISIPIINHALIMIIFTIFPNYFSEFINSIYNMSKSIPFSLIFVVVV